MLEHASPTLDKSFAKIEAKSPNWRRSSRVETAA